MKLHFALGNSQPWAQRLMQRAPKHILTTFAYPKMLSWITVPPESLIIDSGAFSAWNTGATINLNDYITWAHETVLPKYPHAHFVNLDVIPATPGRTSTQAERDQAMHDSLKNADKLRLNNLDVIEVFHQDEPIGYLDHLLTRSQGHIIGLSPRNDQSVQSRVKWLKHVLKHVLQTHPPHNFPRFHGLAATGKAMLDAFPFYSVDSLSWNTGPMYGTYRDPHTRRSTHISDALGTSKPKLTHIWAVNQSIAYYQQLEHDTTRLWEKRGITWSN